MNDYPAFHIGFKTYPLDRTVTESNGRISIDAGYFWVSPWVVDLNEDPCLEDVFIQVELQSDLNSTTDQFSLTFYQHPPLIFQSLWDATEFYLHRTFADLSDDSYESIRKSVRSISEEIRSDCKDLLMEYRSRVCSEQLEALHAL